MNIFVYSDESGVFDKKHNDIFVFGGLIFLDKNCKDIASRSYIHVENIIRNIGGYAEDIELKASTLNNKEKNKLYRSLNNCYKFACIINQKLVLERIFASKKDKQRYLDYAYKIAVKHAFKKMIKSNIIKAGEVENLYFFVDEHSTATNGKYELRESLEQEFKYGVYNFDYRKHHPSIFESLKTVNLKYCNSNSMTLVRASDIVANKVFHLARMNELSILDKKDKFYVKYLP